ncbi:CvpA family protein [Persicirhabdus sediminis]|uniref:CvpA family protein n=1 Tax=Persicirhabdus sediminis TaxID=454144 RepID=A0A8J7MEG3_9BACT|nr:CvpA family protein [Persicirhabdus sediminis]MBK1791796.1 CvpA family protein [Persicirhabdus sediminis]
MDNTTIASVIGVTIVALGVFGFMKGLVRSLGAILGVAAGAYAGFWGYVNGLRVASKFFRDPQPWMAVVVAVLTGFTAIYIVRFVLRFVADPFNQSETGKKWGFGLPAALISLCTGILMVWLAFSGIRYCGALSELDYVRNKVTSDQPANVPEPYLLQAWQMLDATRAGQLQITTDPFNDPDKRKLCQLLIAYTDQPLRQKILATEDGRRTFDQLAFRRLVINKELLESAKDGTVFHFYTAPALKPALEDRQFLATLEQIKIEELLALR